MLDTGRLPSTEVGIQMLHLRLQIVERPLPLEATRRHSRPHLLQRLGHRLGTT
jgi:hypothetical protein